MIKHKAHFCRGRLLTELFIDGSPSIRSALFRESFMKLAYLLRTKYGALLTNYPKIKLTK